MHRSLIFALLITFFFFILEKDFADQTTPSLDLFDFSISRENDGVLYAPPAIFFQKDPVTYMPQIPKVNVITGEYCEEEEDLVVTGVEPISIRRFYNHKGYKNQAYGHWNINPETLMLFNFTSNRNSTYAGVGDENGSLTLCEGMRTGGYVFDAGKNKSFTHAQTGQRHPLNLFFSVNKITPKSFEYYWEGDIQDGSGRTRSYSTEIGLWKDATRDQEVASQAWIRKDRKPNGNILRYTYEDFNLLNKRNSHYKQLNTFYLLRNISAYSASGYFLGSVDLNYSNHFRGKNQDKRRYIAGVDIIGSDQRRAIYRNQIREVRRERKKLLGGAESRSLPEIMDVVLDHVDSSSKPTQFYAYRHEEWRKYRDNPPFLYLTRNAGSKPFVTEYDPSTEKVAAQYLRLEGDEKYPVAYYVYGSDHTIVTDAENNKTIFRFNPDKRIISIEKYQHENLYKVERFTWQPETGNLLSKSIEDGAGLLYYLADYTYDKNHNVVEEKVGDGKEDHTIFRTYSNDGFNLLLTESDRPEKVIRYTYVPNTNLPSSEIIYAKGEIQKRIFHLYDSQINSVRVRTIIDDGKGENLDDLTGVTYRKIIEIQPKRELPCIGLPEEVCEKTIDAHGNEVLLKKVRYAYHPSGKIECEEHYDANDLYRYSVINEYNEQEQLVSTIDPLGNLITREYDEQYNLVALSGPREDMRKEWIYDFANRPTEEHTWCTDEKPLKKKIQYDKLGRVVATVDEKQVKTTYCYDALGRITSITRPGGSVLHKEYDVLDNVTKEIDPNGYETQTEYNYRGKPIKIRYPDGSEEQNTYYPNGTLATHIDKNGAITHYTYDIFDNPIKTEVYSSGGQLLKTTSATFSPFSKLSETNGEGVATYFIYDFAGRKIGEKILDREVSIEYDALGRVEKRLQGETYTIEEHDELGRVIEKRTEALNGTVITREKYQYDPAGNRTHVITSKGTTKTSYDTNGAVLQAGNLHEKSFDS